MTHISSPADASWGQTPGPLWLGEGYRYLQLFTGDPLPDVSRRSLAVEPMTCPANAFRSGEGLVRLEPQESFTAEWGIVPA